ncbi:MAG TPA: NAD(P)H-hydrate dehydratase, partial [Haloplasmataceae bacterium]
IIGNLNNQSDEAKTVFQRLKKITDKIINLTDDSQLNIIENIIMKSSIIIDGIFGIGLTRDVTGLYYECMKLINNSKAYIFSIDIPSGINGNNGKVSSIAIKANFTAIIQNLKLGNLLNDAKDYQGDTEILDIGIIQEIVNSKYLLTIDNLPLLPKRKHNSHKYHYGNLLTVGGSIGYFGAPLMCAYAALKCGGGLSTIGIKKEYYPFIKQIYPEIMIRPYDNQEDFINMLNKKDVVAFGPGLGRNNEENIDLLKLLIEKEIPLVIDADGLFYLKKLLPSLNQANNIVISPHVGEMALLLDTDVSYINNNPLEAVRMITDNYGINVVLKGTCSIIANNEEIYFSNYGNPGMATAGSGDVLTGIIMSLIGQGLDNFSACKLGVYIHTLAGDLAYKNLSYSLIASDIINHIPIVFKELLTRG